MVTLKETVLARALDGFDLVIDFATLGEFGLEPASAGMVGDEGIGCDAGREALAPTPVRTFAATPAVRQRPS